MSRDRDVMQFFQSSLSSNSDLLLMYRICERAMRSRVTLSIYYNQRSVEQVVFFVDLEFSGRNLSPLRQDPHIFLPSALFRTFATFTAYINMIS